MMPANINKSLKFLFISSDKFPPFRNDVAVLFGKELSRQGHRIVFLLQSESDNNRFFSTTMAGVRFFVGATDNGTKLVNRFYKHILSVMNDLRLFRLANKERHDFIQVKDKFIAAIIGIIVARITKSKFFYWLSYPFPEADIYEYKAGIARYPHLYFSRGMFFKLLLYHFILPLSDHIFVQSEQMKKDIVLQGFAPEKITPVPMGIDLDAGAIDHGPAAHSIEREPDSIIYLGTMQKVRRIDFVLGVFRKVLDKIPAAKLYMVGDSENAEDLEYLKTEARNLKIDHATVFTGHLPRDKALEFVGKAAVGISPFFPTPILNSTSPTKLIEYMAMGTPVVANDHPEQRLVIDESKAGFCVRYNEEAFAEAILRLLKDPVKSREMGISGAEYVLANRNYRVIADSLQKQYYALLS
jgi:glycosyltransferase involved in cell wall biosynthesis